MGSINAKQMRVWFESNPSGRLRDLYAAFSGVDIRKINKTMDYLVTRGELTVGDDYVYRPYVDQRMKAAQDKVWRAIRSEAKRKRFVEVDEISLTSGVSRDYSRKYMYWLGQKGYLTQRPNGRYGVLNKAMRKAQAPYWCGPRAKKREADDGLDGSVDA